MKRLLAVPVILLALAAPATGADKKIATGRGGAVAAAEETAARVGIEILKKGGNAADAAVAVAFALAVTWPEAGNIGGGGFWISRDSRGRVLAVDFREVAPRAARRDLYIRGDAHGAVPSSTEGPLASGVPGSVAGLSLAHRRAGRLPWKTVVGPAVRLAREGFVVSETLSRSIAGERDRLAKDSETARVFLPNGAAPPAGSVLKQPDLARTLEAIRDRREDGFYRGRVAREIESGQERDGFHFGAADLVTLPAPSSGPVLAELAMLAGYVGLEKFKSRDASSAHLLAEIEKRAFRDRNRYLGDPVFPRVRQKLLTDPARLKQLAASIDPLRATPSGALPLPEREKPSTTHFSVVDASGGAVSVTTTLNDSFGNARIAPGLGFLWNNEMDDFATKPGQPNTYGLVQGEVNEVAPGKRMLSAMCPVIAAVGGRNAFVWGTPGGSTIPTTNFQILLGILLRGESLADAVAAPRFHQQDFPDQIQLERERFDTAWIAALEKLGHTVVEREPKNNPIGRVHAVQRRADGTLTAVADPRGRGVGIVIQEAP